MNPFAERLARQRAAQSQETEVKLAVREAIAVVDSQTAYIENLHVPPETITIDDERVNESRKLSQLVSNDFPFDESQLSAINLMVCERYACLTGAAGTGKTTTTKAIVDRLLNESDIQYVDMSQYFKRGTSGADDEDDYVVPQDFIPAVAMCSFTGKATQQIKKNFPRDWHDNIMTIHRLLAFVPVYYEEFDEESQTERKKMKFEPTYDADCLLPWDIVIIDEAGMTGLDLWHQLYAALKPGCRIYMIGDINQLPPVHGRSIFGFAMANWPSFELTHIHRQSGVDNPIVENAWRVLKGELPRPQGKFQMIELPGDAATASRKVRGIIPELRKRGIYEPNRDTIITAINGNEGARGAMLGQIPLNNEFALIFNPQSESTRYFIDSGRERKTFATNDKVMATKNDHEAGITNGMTGIITSIVPNPAYAGDHNRFGPVESVNAYLKQEAEDADDGAEFSLEELHESLSAIDQGQRDAKDKRDRGPASHIVTVRFGDAEHGFELPFATLSEVSSLMTAYVVTCHKMQGGESQCIIIICHDAFKSMLYREWLYTAITRASQMCILLYTPTALRTALSKQNIKGKTLKEKIDAFNALQKDNGLGRAVNVTIPLPDRLYEPTPIESRALVPALDGLEIVATQEMAPANSEVEPETLRPEWRSENTPTAEPPATTTTIHADNVYVHNTIHVHIHETMRAEPKAKKSLKELMQKAQGVTTQVEAATPKQLMLPPTEGPYVWKTPSEPYTPTMAPDPYIVSLREAKRIANEKRFAATQNITQADQAPLPKPVLNPWAARMKRRVI